MPSCVGHLVAKAFGFTRGRHVRLDIASHARNMEGGVHKDFTRELPPQRPSRATWACLVSTACVPVRVTINPLAEGAMFSLSGILHCHAHQKGSQSSRGLIDIRCLCTCEGGKLAFGQGRKAPTACYPACATHATQDEASALTDLTTAPPHNASPEERRARCYPRLVRL